MEPYAIVLIVLGFVAGANLILCLCNIRRNKKHPAAAARSARAPLPFPSYRDVELGQRTKSGAMKDGGMTVLGAAAGAVAATAATVTVVSVIDGGGGGGGCDGGGCGVDAVEGGAEEEEAVVGEEEAK